MPTVRRFIQSGRTRHCATNIPQWLAAVRILAFLLLFLMPVQMRAGTSDPHPHAMLQLLLDARDGRIDHHDDGGHAAVHVGHEGAGSSHEPDAPAVDPSFIAGGAMAVLAALVAPFFVPPVRRRMHWPAPPALLGWAPPLESPPPRAASA